MGVRTIDPRAHDSVFFVGAMISSRIADDAQWQRGSNEMAKPDSRGSAGRSTATRTCISVSKNFTAIKCTNQRLFAILILIILGGVLERRAKVTNRTRRFGRFPESRRHWRAATSAPARLREARVAPMPPPTGAAEEGGSPPREARGAPPAPPPSASSGNPLASVTSSLRRAGTRVKRLGLWRTPPPCSPAGSEQGQGGRSDSGRDGSDRTRDGATRTTTNGMVAIRSVLTLRARTRKRRKPRQELACRDRVTWTSARWTHATSWTLEHTSRTLRIPPRGTSTCGRATSGGGRSGGWRPLRRARSPCIAARQDRRTSASICKRRRARRRGDERGSAKFFVERKKTSSSSSSRQFLIVTEKTYRIRAPTRARPGRRA